MEKWDFGENEKVTEVAAIDGVFMITKKTADLYFDERLKESEKNPHSFNTSQ